MSMEVNKSTPLPVTHYNARCEMYPRNPDIKRFPVPDDKVSWKVEYKGYEPVHYTAKSVLAKPVWADDEDIRNTKVTPAFNEKDAKIDRTSFHGDYKVEDGYPLNPVGRTGVIGRGLLGRWGPNHAADPIVTRWKKKNGTIQEHPKSKKRILQFIAIKRADSGEWALPGGMVDPGETVNTTLAREFQEEALDILESGPKTANSLREKVNELFSKNGKEIYCGYVDDPRNTDNAWMETVACNFHDETGDNVGRFELHAGDDAVGVEWKDVDSSLKLYASHSDFIRKTAEQLDAHW